MSTIQVYATQALRRDVACIRGHFEVPQSFEEGDGKRPVVTGVLITSEGEYIQFSDYGVLDGVGRKHH